MIYSNMGTDHKFREGVRVEFEDEEECTCSYEGVVSKEGKNDP